MKYYYIAFLILTFSTIQASIYSSLKKNVESFLRQRIDEAEEEEENKYVQEIEPKTRHFNHLRQEDLSDKQSAQSKANILKSVRMQENDFNTNDWDSPSTIVPKSPATKPIGRQYFHIDPVLNKLRRRFPKFRKKGYADSRATGESSSLELTKSETIMSSPHPDNKLFGRKYFYMNPTLNQSNRRAPRFRRADSDSLATGESSSLELKFWLDEWDEHWTQKKFEAVNSSQHRGDVVNMVAARPWAVSCGDPNQHDMPWGSCTLPAECDAEYRIYRGDLFCGRSAFVCCALQLTNYDLYEGLDVSFDASSFQTDSNEKQGKGIKDGKKVKKKDKNKRKKERDKRKKKIKSSIRQIEKEIKKILNKAFKNGTTQRKKKTRELKKFIEMLKKQFKKDRKSVVSVHEYEIEKIDERLQKKLDQVAGVNEQFLSNDTFRDIVINGTVNKEKVRMLLRSFPELKKLFGGSRRTGLNTLDINEEENENLKIPEKKEDLNILEYDIEYGQLYY